MKVNIKRQKSPESEPYWQSFEYKGEGHIAVSAILDCLNYTDDLYDINGERADRIRWECSCMQALCGGCAMIINSRPALACKTFADEIEGDELTLEPLSKFPVVADLMVDRSIIYEYLNKARLYTEGDSPSPGKHHEQQYSVAKCLKCGLCLEACPNFRPGEEFYGPVFANESYLLSTQTEGKNKALGKEYVKHFQEGCSKALSCRSVCPQQIETLTSIIRMNRKY